MGNVGSVNDLHNKWSITYSIDGMVSRLWRGISLWMRRRYKQVCTSLLPRLRFTIVIRSHITSMRLDSQCNPNDTRQFIIFTLELEDRGNSSHLSYIDLLNTMHSSSLIATTIPLNPRNWSAKQTQSDCPQHICILRSVESIQSSWGSGRCGAVSPVCVPPLVSSVLGPLGHTRPVHGAPPPEAAASLRQSHTVCAQHALAFQLAVVQASDAPAARLWSVPVQQHGHQVFWVITGAEELYHVL